MGLFGNGRGNVSAHLIMQMAGSADARLSMANINDIESSINSKEAGKASEPELLKIYEKFRALLSPNQDDEALCLPHPTPKLLTQPDVHLHGNS